MIIHRWQCTGKTLCGVPLRPSLHAVCRVEAELVTCKNCRKTNTRMSKLHDRDELAEYWADQNHRGFLGKPDPAPQSDGGGDG